MAIDVAPRFTFYRLNTGLVLPISVCFWARFDSTPAAYRTLFFHGNASYGNYLGVFRNSASQIAIGDGAGADRALSSALSNSTWYFVAVSCAVGAGNYKLYWRAEGVGALSSASGTFGGTLSNNQMVWGSGSNSGSPGLGDVQANCHDGGLAYGRLFSGALSEAQLLAESASATALQPEYADWPFTDTATSTSDASGSGNNLTTAGTGSQSNTTGPNISLASPVGAIGETDALLASQRTSSKAAGAVTESDAVSAAGHTHAVTAGALAESDVLAASGHSTAHAVAALAETDTLAPATRTSTHAAGVLAEGDALAAASRSTAAQLGAIGEVDALAAPSRSTVRAAGLIAETDTLAAAGTIEEVGALAELDAISPVARSSARVAGLLTESDVLLPVGHTSSRATGTLAEADALAPAQRGALVTVSTLAEIDTLASVTEEVAGTPRFITRARPLVTASTTAGPTVHMEVRP